MDDDQARREVERILDADLGELTRSGILCVKAPAVASSWRIPDVGKQMLLAYGLPEVRDESPYMRVGAAFQESADPEYRTQELTGYVIAVCGRARIVVAESTGLVFTVPESRDIAPALAHLYPDGVPDRLINSSVDAFVEHAWRWYWLSIILPKVRDSAGEAEMDAFRASRISGKAWPDREYYQFYWDLCSHVCEKFGERDSVTAEASQTMWVNLICGY